MAYTQADLDALDAEIATVRLVDTVQFADQSTKFRSLKDLLELRSLMASSVNGNRTRYAATTKGV